MKGGTLAAAPENLWPFERGRVLRADEQGDRRTPARGGGSGRLDDEVRGSRVRFGEGLARGEPVRDNHSPATTEPACPTSYPTE